MNSERALNPAPGYNRFSEIIEHSEARVIAEAQRLVGYDKGAVGRRLLQRIVELGLNPFLQECAVRHQRGMTAIPPHGATFDSGGLRFNTSEKRVNITPSLWVRSMIEFGAQWLRILAVVTRSAFRNSTTARRKATLLFGVGIDDILLPGNDMRFLEFCRRGPVAPLRDALYLIVECVAKTTTTDPSYCTYSKYPLFKLVIDFPARGIAWLRFLRTHIGTGVRFLARCLRHPLAAILARDIAFHALILHLDRAEAIDSVVITNSHYHVQPLWMRALPGRSFTSHMVWYSQNSIPFTYRFDDIRSYLPNHRHIEVDEIWVWTQGFRDYLADRGVRGRIHVVGPILWYLANSPYEKKSSREAIVVFDVTPFNSEFAEKMGLTYNYYRSENVQAFINDIIAARDAVASDGHQRLPIKIKHKRTFSPSHDKEYLDLIEDAVKKGTVITVPTETNICSLISGAAVVMVIPYSSPAYVAAELRIPTIYYDPTREIVPTHESHPSILFVSGAQALKAALKEVLDLRTSA